MNLQIVQGKAFFNKINKVEKQYNYLVEDLETDVIIVGGGVTGAILSYYFSKNNIKSVLVEKSRIAHGSTGITTALLQYELDGNLKSLLEYTTEDKVIEAYKLGKVALSEIKKFIEENGNKCEYEEKDALLYTGKKLEIKEIEEEYRIRKENGFDVEFINEDNNPFSFDIKGGVYSKGGGAQLDPYKFAHQLLEVATENGAKVYENTEVIKVIYGENKVEAITKYDYRITAKIIIVATGYDTKLFTKKQFGVQTNTYNIATKPVENFEGWFNRTLIRDNKQTYNYYRTTFDNRIIAGGEDVPFINNNLTEEKAEEKYKILEDRIKQMFPKIKNIEAEYKYCGCFEATNDNLGIIGEDTNNKKLWYCLGYGANGILFAILGGMMLSELYKGNRNENLKLFSVDRFNNPQ